MHILGINPSIDASACLIDDNNIITAASEERFQRVKHLRGFPVKSLRFCLEANKKKISDIKAVAVSWNAGINLENQSFLRGGNYRDYPELLLNIPFHLLKEANLKRSSDSSVSYVKQEFNLKGQSEPLEIYYLNHHLSHAASAFFLSPFDRAAILTIDGYGEETSILMAQAKRNKINIIKEIFFPHSIGSLYAAITQYLGFIPNCDEGKVMGLAAWGKPAYYSKLKDIVKINASGEFELDLNYFSFYMERRFRISNKFIEKFGTPRLTEEPISQHHKDIAASLQKVVIEVICRLANSLYNISKEKKLCIAGGVALNCAMNGALCLNTPFENIFIPSAPGDDGNSLGAALYLKHIVLGYPRNNYDEKVYLGPGYEDKEIKKILTRSQIDFVECDNPAQMAARLLAKNKIIGWFQGRMEFGPRALGNRSILAHPGGSKVKERLDHAIKLRAEFRPYAPAILKEKYQMFFKDTPDSPYMSFSAHVNAAQKNKINQVIHKDNTARVQVVDKKVNLLFYTLIKEFEKLTKLPLVLNTSLNSNREPIVNTPEEALSLFFSTDIDAIFLGKYIVGKK